MIQPVRPGFVAVTMARAVGKAMVIIFAVLFISWWLHKPTPNNIIELFSGITYSCRCPEESTIKGLVHFVSVDLTNPDIDLYVTPLDAEATTRGWEYKSVWAPTVVYDESLAILINGTLYQTSRSPAVFPGDWSRSCETVISEYQVSAIHPLSYLLWFEDNLTPHLERSFPPPINACEEARWGISGHLVIDRGKISALTQFVEEVQDARTFVGIDLQLKRLWLVVFENASEVAAAKYLIKQGLRDVIMVDGGDSSCIVIGRGANGIIPRALVWPHRPVANVFGVRSKPSID